MWENTDTDTDLDLDLDMDMESTKKATSSRAAKSRHDCYVYVIERTA